MYERFYQLRERPFALSPDPDYLYPSRVHREALDYLRYGLESHAGFVAITGEIGSGKTTLLQTLLRGLDLQTTVARIVNTMLEPRELLETIMIDFGLDPAGRGKPLLLRDLAQYLVDQRLAGRLVLLVIDEAQNLSLAALEELRMLSNLETEKSKLMQIVLVGQPNLREKLAAPALEQLRQRITVSYHLAPLDADETANYINHRLRRAASGAPLEFPRNVTDLVHLRSRGIPRIINVICDAALVFGYAEERRQVDMTLLRDVLTELEATGVLPAATRAESGTAQPPEAPAPAAATRVPPAAFEPAIAGAPSAPVAAAPIDRGIAQPMMSASGREHVTAFEPAAPVAAAPIDHGIARPMMSASGREQATARAANLDQREQALRQRERELADQRRILAEEYRLLRTQRPAQPPGPAVRMHGPSVAHSSPARFGSARQETAWARIKRFLMGIAAPAMREN
jgi:putative secretion ATPase (PEP-CTERM system associated)